MWYPREQQHRMKEMIEPIQDLKAEFNKKVETLKRTQSGMRSEQKNTITKLENSKHGLTNRMN